MLDVRKLFLIMKHATDPFERNQAKKELIEKLTTEHLTLDEAKYIITILENYADLQERYEKLKNELNQAKEVVKQLNKILNL